MLNDRVDVDRNRLERLYDGLSWGRSRFDDLFGLLYVTLLDGDAGLATLDAGGSLNAFALESFVESGCGLVGLGIFQVLINSLVQVAFDRFWKTGGVHSAFGGRCTRSGLLGYRRRASRVWRSNCWHEATANYQSGSGCSNDATLRSLIIWIWH